MLQGDGNLVLYHRASGRALWASNTDGRRVTHAVMNPYGDLTLYNGGAVVWQTGNTSAGHLATLVVQNDGNAVIYSYPAPPLGHRCAEGSGG